MVSSNHRILRTNRSDIQSKYIGKRQQLLFMEISDNFGANAFLRRSIRSSNRNSYFAFENRRAIYFDRFRTHTQRHIETEFTYTHTYGWKHAWIEEADDEGGGEESKWLVAEIYKCVRDILRFVVGVDVRILQLFVVCYILIWTVRSSNRITERAGETFIRYIHVNNAKPNAYVYRLRCLICYS